MVPLGAPFVTSNNAFHASGILEPALSPLLFKNLLTVILGAPLDARATALCK